jgi:hypothetical protein
MKKAIITLVGGSLSFIVSLVFYIISAVQSAYDDGYGVSLSYGDKSLLTIVIVSLIVIGLGIAYFYESKKGSEIVGLTSGVLSLIAFYIGTYSLTIAIKQNIKQGDYQLHYCIAVLGFAFFALALYNFIKERKAITK